MEGENELPESVQVACQGLRRACEANDEHAVRELLDEGGLAWTQDSWGWTALHYAALSGNTDLCKHLLKHGAVWNMVDNLGFVRLDIETDIRDTNIFIQTAADIAYSQNDEPTYRALVMEGVRSEMLKAILSQSSSDSDMEDESEGKEPASTASNNMAFLKAKLRFEGEAGDERCVDEEGNGVMMGWEAPIMRETARALCEGQEEGFSVVNVGFGLGIVDAEFQKYRPGRHLIIEPHPDVLDFARSKGWFDKPGVRFFQGTWQDYIKALEAGDEEAEFDAIYFDTFSEHYADLHAFFDHLPNLLKDETSRFSFFHGLGATSMTFYDVYTHVAEMHLQEIGLRTDWTEVPMTDHGEVTWQGISRRYWSIPCPYRLPVCRLSWD